MNIFLMALVTSLVFYSYLLKSEKEFAEKMLDEFIAKESLNSKEIKYLKNKIIKSNKHCKKRNETLTRMMWKNYKNNKWYLKTVREIKKRNEVYGIGGLE